MLVLFDGQNALDDAGSYAGGWHAHGAISRLPSTVRRPVLVAIDHGGRDRVRELGEDVEATLAFVVDRVLPEVERHLAIRFDPEARGIGGASMGGLASVSAITRRPDVFRIAIVMSPSVWVAPVPTLRALERARYAAGARIYVDVGLRESDKMIRETTRAAAVVATRLPNGHLFRPDRRGKHREADWKRRLPKALRFAFHR